MNHRVVFGLCVLVMGCDASNEARDALKAALPALRARARRLKLADEVRQYELRLSLGTYDRTGAKDPRWDAMVGEAMNLFAGPERAEPARVAAAFRKAVDAGCTDPLVQFLASRGYAVLQPEFRGSTGYGKAFVERGYGQWGRGMQDDLDDGVDWLVKTGQVDAKRVCIMGMSYGGYAALWGAVRNPDRYRCAVSWAGVSDLDNLMKYDRKSFSAIRYFREWRAKVAGDAKDLSAVSPIKYADKLKIPVFISHGENDARVPVKQSHLMVDALTKSK